MQRFAHSVRLLSLRRCPCPTVQFSDSRSLFKLAIKACGFASSSARGNENPKPLRNQPPYTKPDSTQPARRPPRISMAQFLKRTAGIQKLLQLFNGMTGWDDGQTPLAISALQVPLNRYTISQTIRLCPCADIALCFFNWLVRKGDFEAEDHTYSSLIFRLGKAGRFKDMEEVAELAIRSSKASAVTFTTRMSAYRRANDLDGVVRTWQTMLKHDIQPSSSAFTIMIDTYARMKMYEEAGDCYYQLVHSSVGPTIKTCSVLIHHLVEAEKLDAASDIFNNLTKIQLRANRVTFAYIMMGYAKAGDMDAVLKLFKDFKEYGHSPYDLGESFGSILKYLVKEGRIDDAIKTMEVGWPDASIGAIQAKIAEFKRESLDDVSSIDALFQMDTHEQELGSGTDEDTDEEKEYKEENLTLFNFRGQDVKLISNVLAFVRCLTRWSSGTIKALDSVNVQWDCHLVSEILVRMKRVNSAWKFYNWVAKKPGYCHDRYTCGKMIHMLLSTRQFTRARHLVHEAEENNLKLPLKLYLNLFKHCGLAKQANFAIEMFEKLKESGLLLDELFYRRYIHALHTCGRHWRVASVCAEMRKAGFSLDRTMYSYLIAGFVRAGKLSIAKRLSEQMRAAGFCPDVLMLSDLFNIFHACGKLEKAEKVFKGMQQCGMIPTLRIYETMTQILSSLGKGEEADKLKREIQTLVGVGCNGKRYWLLYYHSVFVNSFKDEAKAQVMMAAG